jgi:REP element-mobilizing transposase RayT
MPNHVHVLIKVLDGHPLGGIVQSWKSFTAKQIATATGRQPPIWQAEYWDRFIRDEAHFRDAARYIDMNPVTAGLAKEPGEWPWGSVGWKTQPPGECGPAARAQCRLAKKRRNSA